MSPQWPAACRRSLGDRPDPYPDRPLSGIDSQESDSRSVTRLGENASVTTSLEPLRRIAAYAVCADSDGRVLLVRASDRSGTPGAWSLPGWRGRPRRGPQPHGRPRDRRRDRPLGRRRRAGRRARRHAGAAGARHHHPHRPADLPGRVRGGTADRPGRPRPPTWPAGITLDEARELPLRPFTATRPRAARRRRSTCARRKRPTSLLLRRARARTGCTGRSASPRTRWPPTRAAGCCSPASPTATRAPAAGTCPAAAPTTASSPAPR